MLAGYCYDLCDDIIAVVAGFGLKTRPLLRRRFRLEGFDAYGRQRLHDCGVSRVACDIGRSGGGMPACPYRKSNPHVLMVESTKHRPSFDTPVALNGPSIGRILP